MITNDDLRRASLEFDRIEEGGSYYPLFLNLLNHGFEIEAYLLILSTWNIGAFRYASFDLKQFKKIIKKVHSRCNIFNGKTLKNIVFNEYEERIISIFNSLSELDGVFSTGASKIMHLINRKVFVMWDSYINGNKPKRYYADLPFFRQGDLIFRKYSTDGNGYFQFLEYTQEKFRDLNYHRRGRTFAKIIDEFNYVNITKPIQQIED